MPLEGDPARWDGMTQRDFAQLDVEEDEVEREAHAEGVDAPAPGEQQPFTGGAAVEERQPEKSRAARERHRDPAALHLRSGLAAEAARIAVALPPHDAYNPGTSCHAPDSPAPGPTPLPACKRPFRQGCAHTRAAGMGEDSSRPDRGGYRSVAVREEEALEKATRRGNYDSGSDYVLEYGELRFSFNEQDFAERVEQAAVKLDFVEGGLGAEELQDLLELAVNGEIGEPTSSLGEHINEHWTELVGPASRSLVHWIRRLVFRGAWLDQRVKEGELDIVFDPAANSFGYVQPERDSEPIELSREPSWARLAYRR
jgi:hypothetical protein